MYGGATLNCVVRVCVRLTRRSRSSGWIPPDGGVVSRSAPGAVGTEVEEGMMAGGGIGLGEEVASPSWECAGGEEEVSREASAGSGEEEELRAGSAERGGGNWTGWEETAEGISMSVSMSVSVEGNEVRAIWSSG